MASTSPAPPTSGRRSPSPTPTRRSDSPRAPRGEYRRRYRSTTPCRRRARVWDGTSSRRSSSSPPSPAATSTGSEASPRALLPPIRGRPLPTPRRSRFPSSPPPIRPALLEATPYDSLAAAASGGNVLFDSLTLAMRPTNNVDSLRALAAAELTGKSTGTPFRPPTRPFGARRARRFRHGNAEHEPRRRRARRASRRRFR